MMRARFVLAATLIALACLFVPGARSQSTAAKGKAAVKLEPVAETKLLMEGLANPNLQALGKLFRDKPKDAEAWGFARGQALLIAETGNLLLLRPPRTSTGEGAWMQEAAALREAGAALARAAAAKDYAKSRAALAGVANSCNRCHQTFRVPQRVDPFAGE
jgi:cytochrome c556